MKKRPDIKRKSASRGRGKQASGKTLDTLPTIVVCGDAGYRRAVLRLLKAHPHLAVAGSAGSAVEAEALLERCRPRLALIDVRLPDRSGFVLAGEVKQKHPGVEVVLIAAEDDEEYRAAATLAGADGLVSRADLARQLPAWMKKFFAAPGSRQPRPDARKTLMTKTASTAAGKNWNRFRSTFNQAAVGIIHSTVEGWILEANRCLCDMLGYSSNELRTRNTRDLTHPDDRDRQDAQRLELLAGLRSSFSSEKRYVCKDGRVIWINRTVALGHETPGADPYLIHTIEDITERKHAEQALQQSQMQYASLVDSLDSIVWEADAQTFQFSFVSQRAEKLLGYPVKRWLAEPTFWQDHMHPEDREWAVAYCIAATRELRPHDFEYRMIAADGRVVWLRDIVNVVSENGRPVRSRGVMVDITASKLAEMDSRRHARARQVLADCSHALVHANDEAALLQEMCRILVQSGGYVQAHIGLALSDDRKTIHPAASAGYEAGYLENKNLSWSGDGPSTSLSGRVVATGGRYISRDIFTDPHSRHLVERARSRGFRSMIGLPLKIEGACIGAISIYAREQDAFDDGEVALLTTLADDIGYGMVTLRAKAARQVAEARLARLSRARRVMAECSQALVHATDESRLLHEMCRIAVESGGFRQAWIAAVTGTTPLRVEAAAHAGYGDGMPMTGASNWAADGSYQGLAAGAITRGEICIARDILNDPLQASKRSRALELNYQSSIALPLREQNGIIIGAVVLHAAEKDAFDGEEIALLDGLAADLSYGITSLRTHQARQQAEQRLRESEQRVREVFDQAAVGIIRTDLNGVLVEVNSKFCSLLGYTREELLGKTVKDITHPDDYGRGAKVREVLQSGGRVEAHSGEKRFLRKDGTPFWAKRTLSAAYDDAGNPKYVIAVIEDISERKQLEQRHLETFEQAAVGIVHTSADGIYLRVNRKFCEILGYDESELVGRKASDFTHPDDRDKGGEYRKLLWDGKLDKFSEERRYLRKDESVVWTNRTVSLARDALGQPMYFIRVIEDISERKAAEERYRATFDNAPMGIMHTAIDSYRILRANHKLCEMLGYTQEELLEMSSTDFVHPDYRFKDTSRYKDQMVGEGMQTFSSERKFVRKDGSTFWVNRTVSLVRDASGKPDYFIRIVEDITERKRAEEVIASERALLRTVIDAVPDRIYVKERGGRFLLQNMANAKAHGAGSPDELLGKTVFDIFPRETAERVEAEDLAIIESGKPLVDRERSTTDAVGNTRWVAASKVPLRDAGGEVIGIVGVNRDITERKISAQRREMEHAVTAVLAESPTLEAAMPRLIRTMCETMDWAYGARWLWSKEEDTLVRGEYWSDFVPDFSGENETPWLKLRFRNPGGLLRRAWFEKEPTWIADVQREESFSRKETALKFGLHSAYSFPVIAGTEVIGVMEFFGRQPRQPDSMLLQISSSIGRQIGQFIQRKQAETALKESEQQFRQLADNIPQVFWITDVDQQEAIYVSPAWEEITGRPIDQIRANARSWLDSVHEEDRARVKKARKAATEGSYDESFRIVRPDGSIRWVHDRAFPVNDDAGKVYRIAGIAEDVTERKQSETQLMQLAHYDVLTKLPNRVLFYDRLKQALAQGRRNQWNVGVMFIDVDRFKNVNDTLGHAVGDKLLQQVSERLAGAVRTGDTVGRLGGDEFSIVLSNLTSAQDANLVAQKIMAGFNEPFKLEGAEIYVTASIGITLYPDDSLEQDTLIKNADAAMYRAKELGRNSYQFYTPEMNTRAQALLSMDSSLRRALDRGEFLLHFQPKASAATGAITGVEALLRWQSPERGLVSPAEFIPVLEETGLIVPVGEWVIKAACAQIKAWQSAGIEPVPVAVNLSARQFQSAKLSASIVTAVEESGIEPRFLELEITESSLMQNADGAISTLQYLKSCGINVSIDDFGTGYSSLAYLKRFPLDALKIDRSFVRDITTDPDDATITRAVISMAHSLGLKVVAEGVETGSQFEFLAENGCDEIQGYLFSRPLSALDCGNWLREGHRLQRPPQPVESAPVVLLVDDDDDALVLLKRALTKDGYQLLTARNAHEALEVLGRNRVDLVITDQHMPGVQGVDFLQRVKRLHPRTVRLMTSGDADVQTVTDAINKGEIFRFLPKGMKEERLRSDVREAIQARPRSSPPERSTPPGTLAK